MRADCGGCGRTWKHAQRVGHCAGCHETFIGGQAFDRHQRWEGERLICVDPAGARKQNGDPAFEQTEDGNDWREWASPEQREAARRRLQDIGG